MKTVWSDWIQTPLELYSSRAMRFREDNRGAWLPLLRVAEGMDALEVGCGSGLLLHRLAALVPGLKLTGLDRDTGLLAFAAQQAKALGVDCTLVEGDALALPFEAEQFDLAYSHTVVEHVPLEPFLAEQRRVLRYGGRVVVLSCRPKYSIRAEGWKPPSGEEKALLDKLWSGTEKTIDARYQIGAHGVEPLQLPAALEAAGFAQVDWQAAVLMDYAPDNHSTPATLAETQIESNRTASLESFHKALRRNPQGLTASEQARVLTLINARHDARLALYRQGKPVWDIESSMLVAVTGVKA